MDISRMRAALTEPQGPFPREAMEWARDNAAQATPALLAMLTACTKAGDISEREAMGAFFALPILAELREPRAFSVLCALARNGDRLDEIYEDFGTEYLHRLALSLYEGNEDSLFVLARDPAVDSIIRGSFLRAWCWHVLHRRADRKTAFDAVAGLRGTIPAGADLLRFEWAQALILLDPDAGMLLVRDAMRTGEIDESIADVQDYEDDAAAWREDPQGQQETWLTENAPVDDGIGLLLRWEQRVEDSYNLDDPEGEEEEGAPFDGPAINRFRDVGRNDPCPCGSGKKFKKCCLAA